MHVALIVDEERLAHEQATLNRMCIGLIGDGIQITRIVPETLGTEALGAGEKRVALASRVATEMTVLPWMRRDRAHRIADQMDKGPPDVIYAIGDRAWKLGVDLARSIDRPLALDVWSAAQLRRLPRGRAAAAVYGYIAPTQPILDALRRRIDENLTYLVPMGIAIPPKPRAILSDPDRSISLAILGGGRDVPAYRALLAGLSRVVRTTSQIQAFLELSGPNEHEIWRHANRLELLHNVSALTDAAQHRNLLTYCDVVLLPEQYGELRSLMLDAMAFGIPVLANDDAFLDMLIDGDTAVVVDPADAETWARKISWVLGDPDEARALGRRGRDWVAGRHRSTDQINRLIEVFHRIGRGGAIPFETGGGKN